MGIKLLNVLIMSPTIGFENQGVESKKWEILASEEGKLNVGRGRLALKTENLSKNIEVEYSLDVNKMGVLEVFEGEGKSRRSVEKVMEQKKSEGFPTVFKGTYGSPRLDIYLDEGLRVSGEYNDIDSSSNIVNGRVTVSKIVDSDSSPLLD